MKIKGTKGNDVLRGTDGNDVIKGGKGDDTLMGFAGTDVLKGGKGDDVIMGGAHADTLIGGPGRDIFIFSQSGDLDTIEDFNANKDTIIFQFDVFGASWDDDTDTLSVVTFDLPGVPVVIIKGGDFTFDNLING